MILNTIRMYRQKFKSYGEIVIVAAGGGNWRKEVYPEYKFKRAGDRDKSKIDWDAAFQIINTVLQEIKDNMPYKVIHQWGCEADDSIAEIVKWTQEFGNYENVMIISADGDFKQLQIYDNVKQFSPLLKKDVIDPNPRVNLRMKVIKGDSGDGVPNVLSDDDVFVEGRRQTPVSKKKLEAITADLDDGELLYAASWYRNYCRNETLIDLTKTPDRLKEKIISEYDTQDPKDNRSLVLPYLINKNMKMLIESVEEFL